MAAIARNNKVELDLKGKSALVTGGSLGIGFAVARMLAEEGCHLHLASRNPEHLSAARKNIVSRYSCDVTCHALDLGVSENAAKLARECQDVDILVNNAGAIPWGTIDDLDNETWRRSWDLKVFGFIGVTRQIYRRMRERRRGVIINIIGAAGERPSPGHIAGSMANAALMALCYALGSESPQFGVRVIGLNPGPIETERQIDNLRARARSELGDANRWRELTAGFPFARLATPEEVANVAVFLASEWASYMSGTVVTIDGGATRRT